ncbi:MAG: ABC transporter substrate-binding protein [Desulfobulbus sp.]|nr:MAG: ABC transporter substrate-binding protein [Desulfobulbus sp.]RUM39184.1 MAG: ABC transporter substrate-binding protein [Desulfobulbus sp.]
MAVGRIVRYFMLVFVVISAGSVVAAPLVDNDGRVTLLEKPFTRIISLYGAHTRNLIDMGAGSQIIAVGRSDRQLPGLPRISFRDDPERLLALKPDLVLIRPMISRGYPQLVERLTRSGVAVVSLQPSSMDELFRYWENLGKLSGHVAEAKQMIAAFGAGLAEIALQVDHIPDQDRKQVYFESMHKRMKTFAPGSMAIFVLESAGGINVATDALQVRKTNIAAYGKEKILARAEKIDVFLAQKGRMNPVSVDLIIREPGFQVIKAIRNHQVFLVDEKLVSRPTLGLIKGIDTVFNLLYPLDKLQK